MNKLMRQDLPPIWDWRFALIPIAVAPYLNERGGVWHTLRVFGLRLVCW